MENNCKTCDKCRFFQDGSCAKFSITVNENYAACGDYAEKVSINESVQKMKLYD